MIPKVDARVKSLVKSVIVPRNMGIIKVVNKSLIVILLPRLDCSVGFYIPRDSIHKNLGGSTPGLKMCRLSIALGELRAKWYGIGTPVPGDKKPYGVTVGVGAACQLLMNGVPKVANVWCGGDAFVVPLVIRRGYGDTLPALENGKLKELLEACGRHRGV